jgi:hypothetical protein
VDYTQSRKDGVRIEETTLNRGNYLPFICWKLVVVETEQCKLLESSILLMNQDISSRSILELISWQILNSVESIYLLEMF